MGAFLILVPFTHKSWDNWSQFYDTIIKNARIIRDSGIADVLRVANGGTVTIPDSKESITSKEQEDINIVVHSLFKGDE